MRSFTVGPLSCPLPTFPSILASAILFIFFLWQKTNKNLKKIFESLIFFNHHWVSPLSFGSSHSSPVPLILLFRIAHLPLIDNLLSGIFSNSHPRGPYYVCIFFFQLPIWFSPLDITCSRGKESCLNHSPLCSFYLAHKNSSGNTWWVNDNFFFEVLNKKKITELPRIHIRFLSLGQIRE